MYYVHQVVEQTFTASIVHSNTCNKVLYCPKSNIHTSKSIVNNCNCIANTFAILFFSMIYHKLQYFIIVIIIILILITTHNIL